MAIPASSSKSAPASRRTGSATPAARRQPGRPFFGMIESVIVSEPGEFAFEGAIPREDAAAAWGWMVREVASDLIDAEVTEDDPAAVPALEALMPELLTRARDALAAAGTSREVERRIRAQLGDEAAWDRLPTVLTALKCRAALDKAQGFGRAANGIHDEPSLASALQSVPLQDRAIAALLFQAVVGNVAAPAKLVAAAIRLSGEATDIAISRNGFAPLIEAMLAHAQSQIPLLSQVGTYADLDLVCRAIDRFHRLVRAVNYVEIGRQHRWAGILAALTKTVSDRLEPKLREVAPDVNKALRRSREGTDRVDGDQLLAALNGMFLLATVRDCRDSLALNAAYDQTWQQVGVGLEMHLQRILDAVKKDPSDRANSARLEVGIKMAELRYGADYADTMRRARDSSERRMVG